MKIRLAIDVEFNHHITNEIEVAAALNTLLATALSTPGVLEDVGYPLVGELEITTTYQEFPIMFNIKNDVPWLELPEPITVEGDGSSLWGDSAGTYVITRIMLNYLDEDEGMYGELVVEGENVDWFQYTDTAIEDAMFELIPVLSKLLGAEVSGIGWSEQGMQPDNGWSFDINFKEDARHVWKPAH